MKVTYCDICGQPIKQVKVQFDRKLIDINAERSPQSVSYSIIREETNEVCKTCNSMITDIFKKRFYHVCEMAEELRKIFKIPARKPKHEKKKRTSRKKK